MFYLTMHSTHFIYGYIASDIWLRTILIVRKESRCRHIGYSFRLAARVLLYVPSHRQDNTYHSLCYTDTCKTFLLMLYCCQKYFWIKKTYPLHSTILYIVLSCTEYYPLHSTILYIVLSCTWYYPLHSTILYIVLSFT